MGAAVVLALLSGQAVAQTSPAVEACPVELHRWSEDCRDLAEEPRPGLDGFRYLPLVADGAIWITLGGELRARTEGLDSVDFGVGDNQINAQVNAQRRLGAVTLKADATLTGRFDTADAIYVSPGRPLATPPSDNRFSAVVLEASARWSVRPGVELYAAILRAEALDAIRAVGGLGDGRGHSDCGR